MLNSDAEKDQLRLTGGPRMTGLFTLQISGLPHREISRSFKVFLLYLQPNKIMIKEE
jgi:hypothetical protein